MGKSAQPRSVAKTGYARYLDFADGGQVSVNHDKVEAAARWDGYRAIIAAGNDQLSGIELWHQYRQLWQVEHGFRTNKHDLRIRPIYHWTTRRIKAHLAICFMAYCCTQHLRYWLKSLGHPLSVEQMRRELSHLQYSVLEHQDSQTRYAIPSPATASAKRIYRSLDLIWNETPFELRSAP